MKLNEKVYNLSLIVLFVLIICPSILAQSQVLQYPNTTFSTIKDDFLVNDDTIGPCGQTFSTVSIGRNGNFVICWMDTRDYFADDIYFQVYDSNGNKIGHNCRVNDDCGHTWQIYPRIAADSVGNFALVWSDRRRDEWGDIFCQLYSATGSPIGVNFRVNDDDSIRLIQDSPDIAMRPDGSFVVVWIDTRSFNLGEIYAQRYDANGNPLGLNFRVDNDLVSEHTGWCSVGADSVGNFYVTWLAWVSNEWYVYARKFNYDGNPITNSFQVCEDTTAVTSEGYPRASCSNKGKFVVSWTDSRNQSQFRWDVYAQLYDESCNPIGTNFRVNDDTVRKHQTSSSPCMSANGNFVICWVDSRGEKESIYAQRFDSLGNPIGSNFIVNENPDIKRNLYPHSAMNSYGDCIFTWTQLNLAWYPDIIAQRYDRFGNVVDTNFIVNDDTGASNQMKECIATYPSKGFVVAWKDYRDTTSSIFYQLFDPLGSFMGENKQVTVANFSSLGDIAMDGHGNFVIISHNLLGQMFDSIGNPVYNSFSVTSGECYCPAVSKSWSGNFVVSWARYDPYGPLDGIYAQRYDSLGNAIGTSFKVNSGIQYVNYCDVAMDSSGNFVVVWRETGVLGQLYDNNGNPIGVNFIISDDTLEVSPFHSSVDMDLHGNFVVVWENYSNGYDIYAQIFDSLGNPIGANIRVNDCLPLSELTKPTVAVHPREDKFVIFWTDWRNEDGDPEVYAQLYENGLPVGSNVQINNPDSFPYNLQETTTHSIDATESAAYFVWYDCRRHKGADIYAKVTDWQLVGCEEYKPKDITGFVLDIFPTISQSSFTIKFITYESHKQINVNIYDVTGRQIRTLLAGDFYAGTHILEWDGRDNFNKKVPAGAFFLKFQAGDYTTTRKLLKIK